MKKSIKTITFQRAHNYGAFLQAYALQTCLKSLNYNVKIIDYQNNNIDTKKPINFYKKNNIKWTIKSIIDYVKHNKLLNDKYKKFNYLIENNFDLTKKVKDDEDILNVIEDNDILITGSDQVWNPIITKGVDDIYTLNINKEKIKKISYAPSFGSIDEIDNYKRQLIKNISKINKISVREKSAQDFLCNELKSRVDVVLDPTLLLTYVEWNDIIVKQNYSEPKEKYILAYDVAPDSEYVKIVNDLSNQSNLKVIHFDLKNIYKNEYMNKYSADPFEFINLIKNAEYIVTTSFHATVFSIIFNKKFWVIPHKKTGKRVTDLLLLMKLSNRVIYALEEFRKRDYNEKINYTLTNEIIVKERKKSKKWLIDAIEN